MATPGLEVLTDAVGTLVAVATMPPQVTIEKAEAAHRRAVAAGNVTAGWVSAGPPMIVATLYAAARTQTRRAGMAWPRRALTAHLLARTRERLDPDEFDRAWRAGEPLTLRDVARGEDVVSR